LSRRRDGGPRQTSLASHSYVATYLPLAVSARSPRLFRLASLGALHARGPRAWPYAVGRGRGTGGRQGRSPTGRPWAGRRGRGDPVRAGPPGAAGRGDPVRSCPPGAAGRGDPVRAGPPGAAGRGDPVRSCPGQGKRERREARGREERGSAKTRTPASHPVPVTLSGPAAPLPPGASLSPHGVRGPVRLCQTVAGRRQTVPDRARRTSRKGPRVNALETAGGGAGEAARQRTGEAAAGRARARRRSSPSAASGARRLCW